jgi:agmatine deiminase
LDVKVKKTDKRNWAYINFLQTKDLILLPKFGIDEDEQAFKQIEEYFPDYKNRIAQVDMTKIVRFGGALNCISWTTKE